MEVKREKNRRESDRRESDKSSDCRLSKGSYFENILCFLLTIIKLPFGTRNKFAIYVSTIVIALVFLGTSVVGIKLGHQYVIKLIDKKFPPNKPDKNLPPLKDELAGLGTNSLIKLLKVDIASQLKHGINFYKEVPSVIRNRVGLILYRAHISEHKFIGREKLLGIIITFQKSAGIVKNRGWFGNQTLSNIKDRIASLSRLALNKRGAYSSFVYQ